MSNFEHAKYDANGVRIDDPTFNTQALREDRSLVNGVTFPAADTVAINTASVERLRIGNAGQTTLLANSASAALTVTQTGAGNAFVVEDSASTDSTPFVIDASGNVAIGLASPAGNKLLVADETSIGYVGRSVGAGGSPITLQRNNTSFAAPSIVASGNILGQLQFSGYDGANYIQAAGIFSQVDGTPGTNDMPGRLVFSTTADGVSSSTERMRIDSAGNVGIGGAALAYTKVLLGGTYPTSLNVTLAVQASGTVPSGATTAARMYSTTPAMQATAFTCTDLQHYYAEQGVISGGAAVTYQSGFYVSTTLTGAANNYGFSSNIAAGANRFNFYAGGTAANYFAGDVQLGKTVTAGGTTGAQTINKTVGTVNFAAAATSLVVTNSLVTTSSIITATVGTNDTTMKSVAVVAAAGSFTLHANAAATAETRVNFHVFN